MFHCDSEVDIGGTCYIGTFKAAPPALKRAFGQPKPGDGEKVYGEYSFTGPEGSVFTLYDWKEGLDPWGYAASMHLHVGGNGVARTYLTDFAEWLRATLEDSARS